MGRRKINEILIGGPEAREIKIAEYDPAWPQLYGRHAKRIAEALGDNALQIEHIGSTSVPGLAAKPIIDILLVVENSGDENSYLPRLEAAGYVLRVREPNFHQHRMLRTPELDVHIHVFSRGSAEIDRYLIFRDRLRRDAPDRTLYAHTKRSLAAHAWSDMNAYAQAKSDVVEQIITRAQADGNRHL